MDEQVLSAESHVAAALEALVASMAGPALDRVWNDLRASVLATLDVRSLNLEQLLLESLARITAERVPSIDIDMGSANTLAQTDLSPLTAVIDAATRTIIDRAAVVGARESSGYRTALYKVAEDHHGYVTTALAQAAGVPPVEVRKLASRGGMTNITRGLYRVDGIDGGDHAPYAEAVLRVGDDAHLVGDSVLAFHDLALVNPQHITVGTPRRVRRDLPSHIRLVQSRINPTDLTDYDGVASTTVERAIRDSIGSVMAERLADATHRAAADGLLRRSVVGALLQEIGSAA